MKTNSKSPYEIRLELLQLAQKILQEKHAAISVNHPNNPRANTAPTTEEIIAEAEKMNGFISNTSH